MGFDDWRYIVVDTILYIIRFPLREYAMYDGLLLVAAASKYIILLDEKPLKICRS